MTKINELLAKVISKVFKGKIGAIIHFLIMHKVYAFLIGNAVLPAISYMLFSVEEVSKIDMFSYDNPLLFLKENPKFLSIMIIYGAFYTGAIILNFIGVAKVYRIYKNAEDSKYQTFGKARFSELEEVLKIGLQGAGIVFGKIGKKIITKPPKVEGHSLIVGGTGTGKSRGVVIPSLLLWEGSAIVMDIKGELSKITSERRKQYGKVIIFNPEGGGDCYDPVKACTTVDQAQTLARTLIPLPEKGEPFWSQSAQAILSAFVYEGAFQGYKISDIAEKICTSPITELVEHCRNHHLREVRVLASVTYDMPDKTLGGIMGELKSKLITIATDPNIRKATSKSDWTPETLEEGATIYLKVSEHLLEQYKDLWTVIISQVLKHLSKREERKEPPILIAIDEMPRLSKIEGLTNALATLRSRNVHIMGVIQSMAQLDKIYGKDDRKVIADNCRFKFVLSATDPETQKYFSDLAGQKTVLAKGRSVGGHSILGTASNNEQGTPLIRPEEWANLEKPILLAPKLQPTELTMAFWDVEKM